MSRLVRNSSYFRQVSYWLKTSSVLPLVLTLSFANAETAEDVPLMEQGIQLGDLSAGRAIVWSRTDRPSRMMVEYAFNEQFQDSRIVRGPYALENSDFTAKQDLSVNH